MSMCTCTRAGARARILSRCTRAHGPCACTGARAAARRDEGSLRQAQGLPRMGPQDDALRVIPRTGPQDDALRVMTVDRAHIVIERRRRRRDLTRRCAVVTRSERARRACAVRACDSCTPTRARATCRVARLPDAWAPACGAACGAACGGACGRLQRSGAILCDASSCHCCALRVADMVAEAARGCCLALLAGGSARVGRRRLSWVRSRLSRSRLGHGLRALAGRRAAAPGPRAPGGPGCHLYVVSCAGRHVTS